MEYVAASMDDLHISESNSDNRGRLGRKKQYDDDKDFKSKNLNAERRRREKLSNRLLTLRSVVPIITNMNKATIIEDAITYIKQLQKDVESLSDQLLEMEVCSEKRTEPEIEDIDAAEEMKKSGIKVEVSVTQISGNKLWVKIIFEKRKGRFRKLMEAMNAFGLELIDTNVTTRNGAFLITTCLQGFYGETLAAQQTKELMQDVIDGI
ncbi:Transcription factor like [Quillaja saponaria]|uniref:Transcription factor like n=1 Tax=Quillaja saponaria TaxID=32244 RepID=A0AAD7PVI9_QUISA|nr:Transcription factor like [Quillaja saponaria]